MRVVFISVLYICKLIERTFNHFQNGNKPQQQTSYAAEKNTTHIIS